MSTNLMSGSLGSLSDLVGGIDDVGGSTLEVKVRDVVPDPDQPRRVFTDKALEELAESIKEQGVLQPITVREVNEKGKYMIVMGERRWRASKLAKCKMIPVIIGQEADAYSQMIENIQRESLTPMEIGDWITARIEAGEKGKDIAKLLGKPPSYVTLHKQLSKLPEAIELLYSKGVTQSPRALVDLKRAYDNDPLETVRVCDNAKNTGVLSRTDLDLLLGTAKQKQEGDDAGEATTPQPSPLRTKDKGTLAPVAHKHTGPVVTVSLGKGKGHGELNLTKPSEGGTVWVNVDGKEQEVALSKLAITALTV